MFTMTLTRTQTVEITEEIIADVAKEQYDMYENPESVQDREEVIINMIEHAMNDIELSDDEMEAWLNFLTRDGINTLMRKFWDAFFKYALENLTSEVEYRRNRDRV